MLRIQTIFDRIRQLKTSGSGSGPTVNKFSANFFLEIFYILKSIFMDKKLINRDTVSEVFIAFAFTKKVDIG
jgi:hypothetical protein